MESMDVTERTDSFDDKIEFSTSDEENENIQRAEELEKEINFNKYIYDYHIELVELYKKLGDLNSMRAAYNRFHECFPLTPKLWMSWLKDEINLACTPVQQKEVLKLFDKAVKDYLSVELWIEYAQYSIGVSDLETTRSILERGLQTAGLHCSEGSLLWDTLRELESAHISLYPPNSEEWKAQVNKLAVVFKRQLSVPLIGMENTYREWQEWLKTIPDEIIMTESSAVQWGYKAALLLLNKYKPFEDSLLTAQSNQDIYDIYKSYINSVCDPLTTICLYERAVMQLCLLPELWAEYCSFSFKFGDIAVSVNSRALRNCPWNEELWVAKIRLMEKQGACENEVMKWFEQGMSNISSNGLSVWMAYLEYIYRISNSAEKMDKLFKQAWQQLGPENDPSFKLMRWHSRLLARRGDIAEFRKLWNSILQHQQNKSQTIFWLEYVNLERQYGDHNRIQNIFKKALQSCTDWPEYLAEEWLTYNREFGTLETTIECTEQVKKLNNYKSVPPIIDHTEQVATQKVQVPFSERKLNKRACAADDSKLEKKKTKGQQEKVNISIPPVKKDPKKTVFISNLHPSCTNITIKTFFPNSVNIELALDKKGKSKCYGFVQFNSEEEMRVALSRDREPINGRPLFVSELKTDKAEMSNVFKYAIQTEKHKLFVRGLPINKSKEDIEEIFKKFGEVDVRLVLHKSGQPKGLAYVEFKNEELACKALKETDELEIDGHKISVAISAPPPKKSVGPKAWTEMPARHARSRLQIPLVPRTLQIRTHASKQENVDKKICISKSNADFRNLILQDKLK